MVELIAQGKDPGQRWRQPLPPGPVTLGRTGDSTLRVPWDRKISRVHARLQLQGGLLHVQRDAKSLNPIFYQGQVREHFEVPPGGWFVIGDTAFLVVGDGGSTGSAEFPPPHNELTLSAEELRRHRYIDPDQRIEVLAGLPGVIRFSPSDAELNAQVTAVLLRGIPRAENAAIISLLSPPPPLAEDSRPFRDEPIIEIIQARNRQGFPDQFRPSRRLVREALERRRQSVMYIWQKGELNQEYTQLVGCDWSLCIPLAAEEDSRGPPGETARADGSPPQPAGSHPLPIALGLYLSGTLPNVQGLNERRDDILRSDLKFTELVGDIFASLRRMNALQRQLGQLRNYLPQNVVNVMSGKPTTEVEELLRPRVTEVTVLFCDIRGSSRIAELGQDNLLRLWDDVSAVLGIMSRSIRDEGGVIADLQGDAIMAFWGWPLPDDQFLARPLRAALTICHRLAAETASSPLGRVRCGIGIAHGQAVVGRLGTPDQFKIDAFGPTVNLAARLESLAKFFGVSIVVDQHCSKYLEHEADRLGAALRRLGRVQPAGMDRVEEVAELVPAHPTAPPSPSALLPGQPEPTHPAANAAGPPVPSDLVVTEETLRRYEAGRQVFEAGDWGQARKLLETIRADGPARCLLVFMAEHLAGPPSDWAGVVKQITK